METDKNPGQNEVDVVVDIERHGHEERIDVEADGPAEIRVSKDEVDIVTKGADGERTVVVVHTDGHHAEHGHGGEHDHEHGHHHEHGHGGHDQPPPPPIIELIFVNENEVKVHAHELTGLQIKQAAIAQGVKIELDFVLAEEFPDETRRIVGNGDVVKLHEGMKFSAVRDDDNS